MKVALVDSPVANVANIERALAAVGADPERTADPASIRAATKIVLPGVGSFLAAMSWLRSTGVADALRSAVENGATLLGICVGHQVLFERSSEMGDHPGLGFCEGTIERYDTELPVPQIGWNRVEVDGDPLFDGIENGTPFYFVNSYRAANVARAIATADYGGRFVAAVRKGSVRGVQFHPEKSSAAGLRVLRNFVESVR